VRLATLFSRPKFSIMSLELQDADRSHRFSCMGQWQWYFITQGSCRTQYHPTLHLLFPVLPSDHVYEIPRVSRKCPRSLLQHKFSLPNLFFKHLDLNCHRHRQFCDCKVLRQGKIGTAATKMELSKKDSR
jgi:hypothetical protein